jgi:hypothetical protein
MIVNRRTYTVKPSDLRAVMETARARLAKRKAAQSVRTYVSSLGGLFVFAMEVEFENLAEYEAFWAAEFARPDYAAFREEFYSRITGGTNEIWSLLE